MKVALVIPAYVPANDYGGPITKAQSLSRELRALGADAEIWTSDFGLGRTRIEAGTRDVDGTPVHYLRRLTGYRWSPVVPRVLSLASRSDIDIAHLFGYRDGLTIPAAFALRRRGIPYVAEMVGMTVPRERNVQLKRMVDRWIGQPYITGAGLIIANSEAEAADIVDLVPAGRVNIVYNPIDLPPIQERPATRNPGPLRVAAVGRLAPIKNFDLLIRAVAEVDGVMLDIIGPTDVPAVEAQLLKEISRCKVQSRVRLRGALFGPDLHTALAEIDVVAMPSKSESFGNAAIEAAAEGIPVIVSDTCGVAPIIEASNAGLVVRANDLPDLVRAIRRCDEDRAWLQTRSDAAAKVRVSIAPREIARQHLLRYERLLGGLPPLPLNAALG